MSCCSTLTSQSAQAPRSPRSNERIRGYGGPHGGFFPSLKARESFFDGTIRVLLNGLEDARHPMPAAVCPPTQPRKRGRTAELGCRGRFPSGAALVAQGNPTASFSRSLPLRDGCPRTVRPRFFRMAGFGRKVPLTTADTSCRPSACQADPGDGWTTHCSIRAQPGFPGCVDFVVSARSDGIEMIRRTIPTGHH